MRLLGRTERQRRNLPCRADPAECCQERREFLSGPSHSFSIDRHLCSCPMRSPPQRGMAGQPIKCCSGSSTTFACDIPPAVLLTSDPGGCSLHATLKSEREFQEVVENRRSLASASETKCREWREMIWRIG